MELVSLYLGYLGHALEIVLLYLLIRGPLGRYFPLFLFILTLVAVNFGEAWTIQSGIGSRAYANIYWGGELLLAVLQMVLVVSVTLRALDENPLRPKIARLMAVIFVAAIVLPFLISDQPRFSGRWYNGASQILNFAAAIMNLMLWAGLVASKNRDRQLLTVSAGMGLALASSAMTWGMRTFTSDNTWQREFADYAHRLLQIAAVLIWCWAFRPARKPAAAQPTAVSGD